MTFRIYTKTGDDGTTGLFGGGRVRKDDLRVEAYGALDELNAQLGVAVGLARDPELQGWLARLQDELFTLGGELATPDPEQVKRAFVPVGAGEIAWMERTMDAIDAEVPPLKRFVLPGGEPAAAQLHVARTVCRRAERRLLTLTDREALRPEVLQYVNRLSDLLFMLARLVNHRSGTKEPTWEAKKP